jgi:hypothetical protein
MSHLYSQEQEWSWEHGMDIFAWTAHCKNRVNGMNIGQDPEELEVVNQRSQ